MTKFEELKERYPNIIPVQELRANVSIVELAVQYGYEPQVHKGKSRPILEHPAYKDTIIIKNPQDAGQQIYQRAGDFTDSGTVIDFIRNRLGTVFSKFNLPAQHEFKNITSVLYDYLRIDPTHVDLNRKVTASLTSAATPRQQFTKELFDIRALEENNYLSKREIAPQTIARPEFAGKVVSQITYLNKDSGQTENFMTVKEHPERKYLTYSNVAFPYYNGQSSEIAGLELRNENVKLHAAGSDRFGSVFVSNHPPKTAQFFVMERAIDALSHQQLRHIKGDIAFNSVYFSTGGQLSPLQVNAITRYVGAFEKTADWKINLAFDNDPKGHRFDLQFIQQMVATKFPLSPTIGGLNRVSYLLPEEPAYRSIRDSLLGHVESYNANLHAQFARSETDTLGQKELQSQQIIIGRTSSQVIISIPETTAALSAINRDLIELTGMNQRLGITKACGKDFNEDLVRDVRQSEKFRYTILDEKGKIQYNGNSAILMGRIFNHIVNSAESEGASKFFFLKESQPFGFHKTQVEAKLEQGQLLYSKPTPEYQSQIQAEKVERTQQHREEKKPLNPEAKPTVGQEPDNQIKPKLR